MSSEGECDVNDDDDNSNGRPDVTEGSDGVDGEDDLLPVDLSADLDPLRRGLACHSYIVISYSGTGSIRLWPSADRSGNLPTLPGGGIWSYPGGNTPDLLSTLYVEGVSPGHGTLSLLAYIDDVLVGYDQVDIDVEECRPEINLQAYTITSDPRTGYNRWEPGRFLEKTVIGRFKCSHLWAKWGSRCDDRWNLYDWQAV